MKLKTFQLSSALTCHHQWEICLLLRDGHPSQYLEHQTRKKLRNTYLYCNNEMLTNRLYQAYHKFKWSTLRCLKSCKNLTRRLNSIGKNHFKRVKRRLKSSSISLNRLHQSLSRCPSRHRKLSKKCFLLILKSFNLFIMLPRNLLCFMIARRKRRPKENCLSNLLRFQVLSLRELRLQFLL